MEDGTTARWTSVKVGVRGREETGNSKGECSLVVRGFGAFNCLILSVHVQIPLHCPQILVVVPRCRDNLASNLD